MVNPSGDILDDLPAQKYAAEKQQQTRRQRRAKYRRRCYLVTGKIPGANVSDVYSESVSHPR